MSKRDVVVTPTTLSPTLTNPLNSIQQSVYIVEADRIELSYKTYTAPSAQENF